jgi:hypothetical protein
MPKKPPQLVFDLAATELKRHGFTPVASKKWFLRRRDRRTDLFQLNVLRYAPSWIICPCAAVRFDEVEDIFHRTSGFMPEFHKGTDTVGIEMWRDYGDEYRIRINEPYQAQDVTDRVLQSFHDIADPYFAKFNGLKAVDSALNNHPTERCIDQIEPFFRCTHGLIVAKLTARSNYDELVSTYRGIMEKYMGGPRLPEFESLVLDLRGMKSASNP